MLNALSKLNCLSRLSVQSGRARWYRPDDVLRILPGTNRAMVRLASGAVVEGTIETLIALGYLTYARTGSGWAIDKAGVWREFTSNAPRITDAGMTIEPAATNLVTNSSAQGAVLGVLGAGGALPTGWFTSGGTGLTKEVVGIGVEDGIPYIDVRFWGTNADNYATVVPSNLSGMVTGTSYASSIFVTLVGGSTSSLTSRTLKTRYNLSSGSTDINQNLTFAPGRLVDNRQSGVAVTAGTLTGTGQLILVFNNAPGATIDLTIRVGCPQVEAGLVASSPIMTAGSAAARAADDFRCPTSWLLFPENGTLVVEHVPGLSLDTTYPSDAYLFGIDSLGTTRLELRQRATTAKGPRAVAANGDGNYSVLSPATGVDAGVACRVVATYHRSNTSDNRLHVNGAAALVHNRTATPDLQAVIGLGQREDGGFVMTGVVREWGIRSAVLTSADGTTESARYAA
ncbi:phage head spike fiber domain-containing protein [Blastochloris tepida]|uniref:Uncharacterized protein n=1 Tax=Blastochloris tepida TaxID=2233851 RepID=A0A348FZ99_9HYPH|nr:hypothetical protein [Blastochloris tepida]BBF92632.1 hypothetical protein BLTE_13170 [Blastochloris tepida]